MASAECTRLVVRSILMNTPLYLIGVFVAFYFHKRARQGEPPNKLVIAISLGIFAGFTIAYLIIQPLNRTACINRCISSETPEKDPQECKDLCACNQKQSIIIGVIYLLCGLIVWLFARRANKKFEQFMLANGQPVPRERMSFHSFLRARNSHDRHDDRNNRRNTMEMGARRSRDSGFGLDSWSVISEPLPAYAPKRKSMDPPSYASITNRQSCDRPDQDAVEDEVTVVVASNENSVRQSPTNTETTITEDIHHEQQDTIELQDINSSPNETQIQAMTESQPQPQSNSQFRDQEPPSAPTTTSETPTIDMDQPSTITPNTSSSQL